jgi:hypothetical protein
VPIGARLLRACAEAQEGRDPASSVYALSQAGSRR